MKLRTNVVVVKSAVGTFTMRVVTLTAKMREKVLIKKPSRKQGNQQ